ncbi:MAG TPA: hypothetical protein VK476_02715, partial [Flavobacterium sp.]|nr:hypothetical protein [Flavobacterium sp.]
MKKILSLFFVLTSLFSFAQQREDLVINWSPVSEMSYGGSKLIIPQFDLAHFQYRNDTQQILFIKKIP